MASIAVPFVEKTNLALGEYFSIIPWRSVFILDIVVSRNSVCFTTASLNWVNSSPKGVVTLEQSTVDIRAACSGT